MRWCDRMGDAGCQVRRGGSTSVAVGRDGSTRTKIRISKMTVCMPVWSDPVQSSSEPPTRSFSLHAEGSRAAGGTRRESNRSRARLLGDGGGATPPPQVEEQEPGATAG